MFFAGSRSNCWGASNNCVPLFAHTCKEHFVPIADWKRSIECWKERQDWCCLSLQAAGRKWRNFSESIMFRWVQFPTMWGAVDKQNCNICGTQPPGAVNRSPKRTQSLTFWWVLSKCEVRGPCRFKGGIVTGGQWEQILRYHQFSKLPHYPSDMSIEQNKGPVHYAAHVTQYSYHTRPDNKIWSSTKSHGLHSLHLWVLRLFHSGYYFQYQLTFSFQKLFLWWK